MCEKVNVNKFFLNVWVLCFLLIMPTLVYSKPIEIRFSHVVSPEAPKGQLALKFKQLVSERIGDDKVVVKIYPNSELFSDSKVMAALLNGEVELAAPSLSKLKKYTTRFQVFDLPFVFASPTAAEKFLQGEYGGRLLRLIEEKGFYGLGYLNNGMRQLSSNQPMYLPNDIQDLTFRYSGSDIAKGWLESVGATARRESFSKVYGLLQTREIDGQMNVWSNIASKKFHEHQKYIAETNHSYLAYIIVSSESFWSKIPNELRVPLEKAMADAITFANGLAKQEQDIARQTIIDSGLATVYKLSVEQRQAWTEAMLPLWQQFEDQIGSGLIQAAASQR